MTIYVGKESEREWIEYMYNWISLLYGGKYQDIVNQLDVSETLENLKKKSAPYTQNYFVRAWRVATYSLEILF